MNNFIFIPQTNLAVECFTIGASSQLGLTVVGVGVCVGAGVAVAVEVDVPVRVASVFKQHYCQIVTIVP